MNLFFRDSFHGSGYIKGVIFFKSTYRYSASLFMTLFSLLTCKTIGALSMLFNAVLPYSRIILTTAIGRLNTKKDSYIDDQ